MEEYRKGRGIRKKGTFENLGRGSILEIRDTVFPGWYFLVLEFGGGLLQGCTMLLGVLGSGARNPHGILELGSQIGSIPSWQGGKIQFWVEFGQSSGEDN